MTKPVQDRYRAGARRTTAQPLAASWRPDAELPGRRTRKARPSGVRGALSTYGWRIYAVPLLVALTVLVLIDTNREDESTAQPDQVSGVRNDQAAAPPAEQDEGPRPSEQPAVPPNPNIPTAELPKGAAYAQKGQGAFDILPGRGQRRGTGGELFTYTIEIERGVDLRPFGGNDSFAALVDTTLADPRGWAATGQVSVQRVDSNADNPDIRITLATPDTVHRPEFCGFDIRYESSCWRRSESRVMINLARWVRGAIAFGGDIGTYRTYAINHEIGHAFGNGHVGCAKNGDLAPVMMQQSFGVSNNYVAQLNDQVGNDDPVQADGKTCRYNAWPNPQAR